MLPALTGCLLALALGVRHAVEPDHLAAVSTLIAGERRARRALALGAAWGLGHLLALLALGGAFLAARRLMPARVEDALELGVAGLLFALGLRALRRSLASAGEGAPSSHRHGATAHAHAGPREHVHVGSLTFARRSLLVGVAHGLAGSGALTAVALASMSSLPSGLWFILWFGVGAMAGMVGLVGLASLGLHRAAESPVAQARLLRLAGGLSVALGAIRGWPLALRLLGA